MIGRRGIPTTIANYGEWQPLALEAIWQYKSDRLRSIMIIGHSLGGGAAAEMGRGTGSIKRPGRTAADARSGWRIGDSL